MIQFFETTLVHPLYNLLVLIAGIPFVDAGLAVVLMTLLVRSALLPLSKQAEITQIKMQKIQPEFDAIKEKYKEKTSDPKDKEKMAMDIMELYKKNKVNPFASFFLILIQFPILIALYWIFSGTGFPSIKLDWVYSFIPQPEFVSHLFLGIFDVGMKNNFILAGIAGVLQYIHARMMILHVSKNTQTKDKEQAPSLQADLAKSMKIQAQYVFPAMTAFIGYTLPAVISIYFITGSIFSIAQAYFIRKGQSEAVFENAI